MLKYLSHRSTRATLAAVCVFGLGASQVDATPESRAAANFLLYQPSARSAGLGDAYVAIADDANATFFNPAALADDHLRTDAGRGALQAAVKHNRVALVEARCAAGVPLSPSPRSIGSLPSARAACSSRWPSRAVSCPWPAARAPRATHSTRRTR